MPAVADLERPSVSVAYVQILVELLAERGIGAETFFAGMPHVASTVADVEGRVSPLQLLALASRAIELTDDPALGYEYGLRLRPTTHGFLGYAALSSASVREAAEHVVRYARVRSNHLRVSLVDAEGDALMVATERAVLPLPNLRRSIHEALAIGCARGLALLLGRELEELSGVELWFDTPEPDYYRAWAHRLPTMRFETGRIAVRVPRSYLELTPVLADPYASKQAIAQCERELAALPLDEVHVVERVRAVIGGGGRAEYPTLDEAAKALAMSSRTLKRRLHECGTTYLVLVNERRERAARELLSGTAMPVADVATSLGYDPPSFTRAFSRWTGMTPSEFRERANRPR